MGAKPKDSKENKQQKLETANVHDSVQEMFCKGISCCGGEVITTRSVGASAGAGGSSVTMLLLSQ